MNELCVPINSGDIPEESTPFEIGETTSAASVPYRTQVRYGRIYDAALSMKRGQAFDVRFSNGTYAEVAALAIQQYLDRGNSGMFKTFKRARSVWVERLR